MTSKTTNDWSIGAASGSAPTLASRLGRNKFGFQMASFWKSSHSKLSNGSMKILISKDDSNVGLSHADSLASPSPPNDDWSIDYTPKKKKGWMEAVQAVKTTLPPPFPFPSQQESRDDFMITATTPQRVKLTETKMPDFAAESLVKRSSGDDENRTIRISTDGLKEKDDRNKLFEQVLEENRTMKEQNQRLVVEISGKVAEIETLTHSNNELVNGGKEKDNKIYTLIQENQEKDRTIANKDQQLQAARDRIDMLRQDHGEKDRCIISNKQELKKVMEQQRKNDDNVELIANTTRTLVQEILELTANVEEVAGENMRIKTQNAMLRDQEEEVVEELESSKVENTVIIEQCVDLLQANDSLNKEVTKLKAAVMLLSTNTESSESHAVMIDNNRGEDFEASSPLLACSKRRCSPSPEEPPFSTQSIAEDTTAIKKRGGLFSCIFPWMD